MDSSSNPSGALIEIRHNIEVAHRLWKLEGDKCQQIHGHSMWVAVQLEGAYLLDGILHDFKDRKLDFGSVKKSLRGYLDSTYDHRLLLNKDDPFAKQMAFVHRPILDEPAYYEDADQLPGLQALPDDPSTENLAIWIAQWTAQQFACDTMVRVNETHVNSAIAFAKYVSRLSDGA